MTVRAGMESIIQRLRHMGQAGMEDYTVVDMIYWSDDHVQDILDNSRKRVTSASLRAEPQYINGTDEYKRYVLDLNPRAYMIEGTAGGTAVFRVADSNGTAVSGYTWNENDLSVTFTADTDGSAYYLSGYAYDLNKAARELWLMKASHAYTAVNFSADGHRFDREKIYDHCMQMVTFYERQGGGAATVSSGKMRRTDTHGPGEGGLF